MTEKRLNTLLYISFITMFAINAGVSIWNIYEMHKERKQKQLKDSINSK